MFVPNLKEFILSAALGRKPEDIDAANAFSQSLPAEFGNKSLPTEPSGIQAVLPSYEQRVDQIKQFLAEDTTEDDTPRALVLVDLVWKHEPRWIMGAKEDMDLRLRLIDVAYKKQKDDDALTALARKAMAQHITPADVMAEIESINASNRQKGMREEDYILFDRRSFVSAEPISVGGPLIHCERN